MAALPFKERVKHAREQQILDAAADVFATHGFEHASIDAIAEKVGIGKGTVYLHFPGKEDILAALFERVALEMVEDCKRHINGQSNALEKLHVILQVLVDQRYSNAQLFQILVDELPHFIGSVRHRSAGESLRAMIAGVIEEGKAEGSISRRIDSASAAKTLPFLVFASAFEQRPKRPPTRRHVLDSAEQLYFHGIVRSDE